VDQNGKWNSTIKQWTENKVKGTAADAKEYRIYEAFNDIDVIDKSVTDRPDPSIVIPANVVQTFSVTYKKPFKAQGLTDINYQPLKDYNLTSAWGCFKKDASTGVEGSDPDALYANGVGCKGVW